jgi:hypothetical protein
MIAVRTEEWKVLIERYVEVWRVLKVSSKVNAIDLTIACPEQTVYVYSVGSRLAIDSLKSGLHEQEIARSFDQDLAQSTFESADNALLQLMQK